MRNFFYKSNKYFSNYNYSYILQNNEGVVTINPSSTFVAQIDSITNEYVLALNGVSEYGFVVASDFTESTRINVADTIKNEYIEMQNLVDLLEQIIPTSNGSRDEQVLSNIKSSLRKHILILGNIYKLVTNTDSIPVVQKQKAITQTYCSSLRMLVEKIDAIERRNLKLQKIVNINVFDRQISFIGTDLAISKSAINELYKSCF